MERLLRLTEPLQTIRTQLSQIPWDSLKDEVLLTADHLSSILERFLAGCFSIADVEDWANLVEGREDIGFPCGDEETVVKNVLFELANPIITQQLSPRRAEELLAMLRSLRIAKDDSKGK